MSTENKPDANGGQTASLYTLIGGADKLRGLDAEYAGLNQAGIHFKNLIN